MLPEGTFTNVWMVTSDGITWLKERQMRWLLDSDILCFRQLPVSRSTTGRRMMSGRLMDMDDARDAFSPSSSRLRTLKGEILCYYSDPNSNFRKDIDPTYKGGRRKSASRPVTPPCCLGARKLSVSHASAHRGGRSDVDHPEQSRERRQDDHRF